MSEPLRSDSELDAECRMDCMRCPESASKHNIKSGVKALGILFLFLIFFAVIAYKVLGIGRYDAYNQNDPRSLENLGYPDTHEYK